MPLSFAAVLPHGDALIPGMGNPINGHPRLTEAMRRAAAAASEADLDAVIMADPHGIGLQGIHSITLAPRASGSLGSLKMDLEIHLDLAEKILNSAISRGIPMAGVALEDESASLPIEWGTIVPAWFLEEMGPIPPMVIICPSRDHGLHQLADLGRSIAVIAEGSPLRIGLVASADHAHAHLDSGPYGFHPNAGVFDELVVQLTREERFDEYLGFEPELLETALPDSPWQLAILSGAFDVVSFRAVDVTYECPSYFGMMVACFERVQAV